MHYGPRRMASVARLPDGPDGDDGLPPADLYKVAVDEYRFQTTHNWSRTQYLLAFNLAILASASAVASQPGRSAALVFASGAVAAVLSILALRTQHDYYRAARDRMRRVEETLRIPADLRADTTSTLGDRSRLVSVTQVVYLLFVILAVSDAVGFAIILAR